jgi:hypothetical protein
MDSNLNVWKSHELLRNKLLFPVTYILHKLHSYKRSRETDLHLFISIKARIIICNALNVILHRFYITSASIKLLNIKLLTVMRE